MGCKYKEGDIISFFYDWGRFYGYIQSYIGPSTYVCVAIQKGGEQYQAKLVQRNTKHIRSATQDQLETAFDYRFGQNIKPKGIAWMEAFKAGTQSSSQVLKALRQYNKPNDIRQMKAYGASSSKIYTVPTWDLIKNRNLDYYNYERI